MLVGGIAARSRSVLVALTLFAAWALHQRSEARKANSWPLRSRSRRYRPANCSRPDVALRLGLEA